MRHRVYKLKKNILGEVLKHKERLLVKGYHQRFRIDYDEVFSHIACFNLILNLDYIGSPRVLEFTSFRCEIHLIEW